MLAGDGLRGLGNALLDFEGDRDLPRLPLDRDRDRDLEEDAERLRVPLVCAFAYDDKDDDNNDDRRARCSGGDGSSSSRMENNVYKYAVQTSPLRIQKSHLFAQAFLFFFNQICM